MVDYYAQFPIYLISRKMTNLIVKIHHLLNSNINQESLHWLNTALEEIKKNQGEDVFFFKFASIGRMMKSQKGDVKITEDTPVFSISEITRILILLQYYNISGKNFDEILHKIKITADTAEIISLNKGLLFFPYSENLRLFAEEGLRSNMKNIFESVALENSFAEKYFNEITWNQMILKALFIEAPLYQIRNFEARKNEELSRMTNDYALERIVAFRKVNPELWHCINGVNDLRIFDHWLEILKSSDETEVNAILNALQSLQSALPTELQKIKLEKKPKYNWTQIGQLLEVKRKVIT